MKDFQVVYRFSVFEFMPASGVLMRNGGKIQLYFQAAQVLTTLLASAGQLVTRQQLEDVLWPDGDSGDHERGVNRIVSYLRTALSDNPRKPRFIETLPKRGYRFCGPVTAVAQMEAGEEVSQALDEMPTDALTLHGSDAARVWELTSTDEGFEPAVRAWRQMLPLPARRVRWWAVGAVVAAALLVGGDLLRMKLRAVHGQVVPAAQTVIVVVLPNGGMELAPEAQQLQAQLVADLKQLPHIEVRTNEDATGSSPHFAPSDYAVRGRPGDKQPSARVTPLYLVVKLVPAGSGYHLSFSMVRDGDALDGSPEYDVSREKLPLMHKVVTDRFYKAYSRILRSAATQGKPTDDVAYGLYLRAQPLIESREEESMKQAEDMLKTATARDPGFAGAKARLALVMMLRTRYQESTEDPAYQQSRRLAAEAVDLDPDTAEAHEVLGYLAMYQDWNFELAEHELRNAVDLDAFDVPTRTLLATLLSYEGAGAESLEQLHIAQQQAPNSRYLMHNEVLLLSNAGRLAEMLAAAKKAAKRFPDDANTLDQYGWALWYNRAYAEALEAWIAKARLEHNASVEQFETAGLAVLRSRGMPAYAELKIAAIRQKELSATTSYDENLAEWYMYANQPEQALDALEQAYQHRDSSLFALKADPVYAPLRGKQRYENLLGKMHLEREGTAYSDPLEVATTQARSDRE